MAFFSIGSHFVLFPNAILSIFGVRSGAQLNSLTILPKGLSMLAAYFLSNALISSYGYEFYNIFFYISCGLSSISLMILLFFFDETPIRNEEPDDDDFIKVIDDNVKTQKESEKVSL